MFAGQWRKPEELQTRVFELPNSNSFEEYYDRIQGDLQTMSGMDELLAGTSGRDCSTNGIIGKRACQYNTTSATSEMAATKTVRLCLLESSVVPRPTGTIKLVTILWL